MSVLSLEGSIAAGKGKALSMEQCRKRVEKAFESDKLAGVLLRQAILITETRTKRQLTCLRINSPGGSAVQVE